MKWANEITNLFKTKYPIVQAPMFGVATPEMVKSATDANVLGSLPLGDLPPEKCIELIRTTRKLTEKPFAVNLFVYEYPAITPDLIEKYNQTKLYIEDLARSKNLEVKLHDLDTLQITDYRDQVDATIGENCKILSFIFGQLDDDSIEKLKRNNVILVGTCTCVSEAKLLEAAGIDVICVQGIEAGGHRGSFETENIPQIGGLSLLAQVYESVKVPLIYGGGIYNGKTLLAMKTLGAQGFQVGSLLLGSAESALLEFEKQKLRQSSEKDIILSKSFSGRYARGLVTEFSRLIEATPHILPYPYQNKLTAELRKEAKAYKNTDFVGIWTGQSINSYSSDTTKDIFLRLIADAEKNA